MTPTPEVPVERTEERRFLTDGGEVTREPLDALDELYNFIREDGVCRCCWRAVGEAHDDLCPFGVVAEFVVLMAGREARREEKPSSAENTGGIERQSATVQGLRVNEDPHAGGGPLSEGARHEGRIRPEDEGAEPAATEGRRHGATVIPIGQPPSGLVFTVKGSAARVIVRGDDKPLVDHIARSLLAYSAPDRALEIGTTEGADEPTGGTHG